MYKRVYVAASLVTDTDRTTTVTLMHVLRVIEGVSRDGGGKVCEQDQ